MERRANSLLKIPPFPSFSQSQALAALRMSRIRIGKELTDGRRNSPQMEREIKSRYLPRSFATACAISGLGSQPSNRARITTVPRIVRHYFPNHEVQLWWTTPTIVMADKERLCRITDVKTKFGTRAASRTMRPERRAARRGHRTHHGWGPRRGGRGGRTKGFRWRTNLGRGRKHRSS